MKLLIITILLCVTTFSFAKETWPFGSEDTNTGFRGIIYDLKQDRDNEITKVGKAGNKTMGFYDGFKDLIRKKFSDNGLKKYFKGDRKVYLKYLLVKKMPAADVPDKFSSDYISPERLIIVYKGTIEEAPTESFRFGGVFDDAICVLVNGKVVFYVSRHKDILRYKPKAISNKRRNSGVDHTAYGDYIKLKKGDEVTLVVAEIPGGKVGGQLLVQLEKHEYAKDSSGDPKLHPFICDDATEEDLKKIKDAGLETENIPKFRFIKQ